MYEGGIGCAQGVPPPPSPSGAALLSAPKQPGRHPMAAEAPVQRHPEPQSPPSDNLRPARKARIRRAARVFSLLGALALPPAAGLADDRIKADPVKAPVRQERNGSLVILGGGPLPETARDRFLDLAGG